MDSKPMAFQERVFSGVQPTGNLHLGNYLGAIKRFVELQDRYDCIYCVVDLHAITVWQDPAELPHAIREVTAAFIACGIDPAKHIVFNQSQVAEHAELAWVFNCVARLGWLNRMTQFKEKAGKDRENASVGLYAYPVLMAADILVYRATHVPVGEDQKQHLELSRDIAQKFNNDFGESIAQPRLRRRLLSAAGAADHRPGDARHVAARRLEENVEVGPVRLFAHQSHRRRRRDRAENPQGQDRSRAAAERGRGPRVAARGRQSGRHLCGARRAPRAAGVLAQFGGAQFSTFKSALVDLAVAKLGPIGAEMKRLMRDPVYYRLGPRRRRRRARESSPARP